MSSPRNRTAVCNAGALFSEVQYRLWLWHMAWFFCPLHQFLLQSLWPLNAPSCISEYSSSCHIRLDVLTDTELRARLLLSHSVWKFADSISLHLCMFSSDVILCSFLLPWSLWSILLQKVYTGICFLSMCWCSLPDCTGLVQEETDTIPVLFLCSILFTHFCINNRCSDL